MSNNAPLIPPTLRAQLPALQLRARVVPPHGPLGHTAGRQRGQGLEFSQYRAYEPGDEPRHIDWKLFARSDRYFVREADSDAALTLWIVLDTTASMLQADLATPTHCKFDLARTLAAAACDVALRQGDRFGLLLVGNGATHAIAPARGPRQRDQCLLQLQRARCGGTWPPLDTLRPHWASIAPASVVLFLGDGFDDDAERFALQLAATRRDVRCLALTAVDERDFAMRGAWTFEDPETGARLDADAPRARAAFRERFQDARAALARRLAAGGVVHTEHVLDGNPLLALRSVLDPRGGAR